MVRRIKILLRSHLIQRRHIQNTDNMVAGGYSSTYFEKGQWRVPNTGGGWDFTQIRYCNYFFENVLPKFEAGKIEGNCEQILHYVGEMYFIRAWIYYSKLKSFGDFPIITEVLPDNQSVLTEKSVRQPRNLVARFIINQLDSAAKYMVDDISGNKTRLTKNCALLIKSRVALYEATFEKYHKGTGRVPGDATWPGKRIHTDFSTNMDNEINFFLDEAMKAAEQVADDITLTNNTGLTNPKNISGIVGWNPYFEMFAEEDMSSYSEVLFWKQYMNGGGVSITHGTPAYIFTGGNNGMLKSFVDCFVMKDGLPYYAAGDEYKGDKTIMDVKENRDLRLQMFVLGEKDLLPSSSTEEPALKEFKQPNIISLEAQTSDNACPIAYCIPIAFRFTVYLIITQIVGFQIIQISFDTTKDNAPCSRLRLTGNNLLIIICQAFPNPIPGIIRCLGFQ